MIFTASINVHDNPELIRKNIDLLKRNVTDNIVLLVEKSAYQNWPIEDFNDVIVIEGFKHNFPRNPYKNVLFNLKHTYERFPNSDWYVFTEFDNFIVSEKFKNDFQYINENYSLITTDFREVHCEDTLFSNSLEMKFEKFYCMLGCCYFIKKNLMEALYHQVFEKFLTFTSLMPEGFYPNFNQYDVAEVLIPTICMHNKFDVLNLCRFTEEEFEWKGMGKKYAMRFRPNIHFSELSKKTCIVHPVKETNQLKQIMEYLELN